jgi:hypothetical protein
VFLQYRLAVRVDFAEQHRLVARPLCGKGKAADAGEQVDMRHRHAVPTPIAVTTTSSTMSRVISAI